MDFRLPTNRLQFICISSILFPILCTQTPVCHRNTECSIVKFANDTGLMGLIFIDGDSAVTPTTDFVT